MKTIKSRINLLIALFAAIVFVWTGILSIGTRNQNWFGVGAGLLAILAISSIGTEYFFPPKRGEKIKAPDALARRISGTIGIVSGTYWVLSAWPSFY